LGLAQLDVYAVEIGFSLRKPRREEEREKITQRRRGRRDTRRVGEYAENRDDEVVC
jgi:hypothetical protein